MRKLIAVKMIVALILAIGGTAYGQTGTVNADLDMTVRVIFEEKEYEVKLDYYVNPSDPGGLYWQFEGVEFIEITNALGMTFRLIPSGIFNMGSPEDLSTANPNTGRTTLHQVTITNSFYMQITEVTQAQWSEVMGTHPSAFSSCGRNCPVENVSWEDAQAFITALNALGQGTYRLPTEAEWEYAARAGSTTAFANGPIIQISCGDDPNLDGIGWYCYNAEDTTHSVGQKQANAWGLYDMHGNVWEWCQDPFQFDLGSDAAIDPQGPASGALRMNRGGGWYSNARDCHSAYRYGRDPGSRYNYLGFRLVRDP